MQVLVNHGTSVEVHTGMQLKRTNTPAGVTSLEQGTLLYLQGIFRIHGKVTRLSTAELSLSKTPFLTSDTTTQTSPSICNS